VRHQKCFYDVRLIRVRYSIKTDAVGSECSDVVEYSKEEWDAMADDVKEAEMREIAFNHLEWNFEVE
jgi:hypothetical protein